MKIYIAGKITGNPNYKKQFAAAEERLKTQGNIVVNPVMPKGFNYKDYIFIGLMKLSMCDAIYMLNGWERSKGAKLEKQFAETLGMRIFYQTAYMPKAIKSHDDNTTLGKRIETTLKLNNMSQIDLCNEIGMKTSTLNAIITGERKNPRIKTIVPIARGLGVSLDELLGV